MRWKASATVPCALRCGDVQSGIAYLRQALDLFERLMLAPDANRIRDRLARIAES